MNVLVIPGGGIFGYRALILADLLQHQLKKPLHEVFDLVAGTSTGSIIAGGIAIGMSPTDMMRLYREDGPKIFRYPRSFLTQITHPKHSVERLNRIMEPYFGEFKMKDAITKLMVFTTKLTPASVGVYKSWRGEHQYSSMLDAITASAAAPTYFGPHKGEVDGGIYAADPSREVLADVVRLREGPVNFVVLGTGEANHSTPDHGRSNGLIFWGKNIISLGLHMQIEATEWGMQRICPALGIEYMVLNPEPISNKFGMDDASRAHFNHMNKEVAEYVSENREKVNKVVKALDF